MINQTRLNIISIKIVIESKNQLKIINFVEDFKNTSNHIKTLSGRQQENHICLTYLILACNNQCNPLTPGLLNA